MNNNNGYRTLHEAPYIRLHCGRRLNAQHDKFGNHLACFIELTYYIMKYVLIKITI